MSAYGQQVCATRYSLALVVISRFTPEKGDMREALHFCFNLKHSAAKSYCLLGVAYRNSELSENFQGFSRFKYGSFDLSDKQRENRLRKVEDPDFHAVL